jgi:hypothetical protein
MIVTFVLAAYLIATAATARRVIRHAIRAESRRHGDTYIADDLPVYLIAGIGAGLVWPLTWAWLALLSLAGRIPEYQDVVDRQRLAELENANKVLAREITELHREIGTPLPDYLRRDP